MWHDLRTPLTSIIGYLELLSGKVEIPAEMQKKYIDIAYAKSKRLEKLIEDLFGFTKMNYGKVAMHVSKVDIVKLLSQLLEEFYPSFKDKTSPTSCRAMSRARLSRQTEIFWRASLTT